MVGLSTAILFFGWQPNVLQLKVLSGIATSVLTMMGFDVVQFVGKRFSDAGYLAARSAAAASAEAMGTAPTVAELPAVRSHQRGGKRLMPHLIRGRVGEWPAKAGWLVRLPRHRPTAPCCSTPS